MTRYNKVFHHDDQSKANVLNELFTGITSINDHNVDFPRQATLTNEKLDSIRITTRDVTDAIDDTPANKSPGPDYISPIVIKRVKTVIAPILARLYIQSSND